MAKASPCESDLAVWAVKQVRNWGGVLEHPSASRLWAAADLPDAGGGPDRWGGWTLDVDQLWWGHRARKRTKLYIVGIGPRAIPQIPLSLSTPLASVANMCRAERERTPRAFAEWLCELASQTQRGIRL
jgi:hypothetical protein